MLVYRKPCKNIHKIGDGVCDDEANIVQCMNDFGDCCKPIVNTTRCFDCICPLDDLKHPTSINEYIEFSKEPNSRNRWHLHLEAKRRTAMSVEPFL